MRRCEISSEFWDHYKSGWQSTFESKWLFRSLVGDETKKSVDKRNIGAGFVTFLAPVMWTGTMETFENETVTRITESTLDEIRNDPTQDLLFRDVAQL